MNIAVDPVYILMIGIIKKNGNISLYLHFKSNISSANPKRMVKTIVNRDAK